MMKTDWLYQYNKKLTTAEAAARAVCDDDFIMTPLCLGQPSTLIPDAIADRKDELKNIEWRWNLATRPYKMFQPEYRKTFKITSGFTGTPFILSQFQGLGYGTLPGTVFTSLKQCPTTATRRYLAMVTLRTKTACEHRTDSMFSPGPPGGAGYLDGICRRPRILIEQWNYHTSPPCGDTKMHIPLHALRGEFLGVACLPGGGPKDIP